MVNVWVIAEVKEKEMNKYAEVATRLRQIVEGADKWQVNRWIRNARLAHERHMRTSWPRYEKATKAFSRLQLEGMLKNR